MALSSEALNGIGEQFERVRRQQIGVTFDMPLDGARVGKEAKDGYERCNSGENGGHRVKRDARGDEAQIISFYTQDDISADFEEFS